MAEKKKIMHNGFRGKLTETNEKTNFRLIC